MAFVTQLVQLRVEPVLHAKGGHRAQGFDAVEERQPRGEHGEAGLVAWQLIRSLQKPVGGIRHYTHGAAQADQVGAAAGDGLLHGIATAKAAGYHQGDGNLFLHGQGKIDEVRLSHHGGFRHMLLLFFLDPLYAQQFGLLIGAT